MIIRNAAMCTGCNDFIQSTHVHDFQTCKCGNISVDGGNEYFKAGYNRSHQFFSLLVRSAGDFIPQSVQLENSEVILGAHHPLTCIGEVCSLHKRTDHEMRNWRQSIQMVGDVFVVTRICQHNIEHTDPDDYYIKDIDRCSICNPKKKGILFVEGHTYDYQEEINS